MQVFHGNSRVDTHGNDDDERDESDVEIGASNSTTDRQSRDIIMRLRLNRI